MLGAAILFEILIALSLISVLLTCLFSFMVGSAKCETKLDAARQTIGNRAYLQTRLQSVLTSVIPGEFYMKKFDREKTESLVIAFDNDIDPDPAFSGPIHGRIHIDEKQNLALSLWPPEQEDTWRKEVLLPNVERFEFEFLGKKGTEKEKMRPINAQWAWRSRWTKTDLAIPSVIRLLVWEKKQEEPVRFAFLLPSSQPLITYGAAL